MRKPDGKRPHGKSRRRLEDNIKTDFQEVGSGAGSISLRTGALVNVVMNLRVP